MNKICKSVTDTAICHFEILDIVAHEHVVEADSECQSILQNMTEITIVSLQKTCSFVQF